MTKITSTDNVFYSGIKTGEQEKSTRNLFTGIKTLERQKGVLSRLYIMDNVRFCYS